MNSDPWQIIRSGASGMTGMRRLTLRDLLLVGQNCDLRGAGNRRRWWQSADWRESMHSNFGFDPKNVMLVETNLQMGGYTRRPAARAAEAHAGYGWRGFRALARRRIHRGFR